jgi:hypothetical protein
VAWEAAWEAAPCGTTQTSSSLKGLLSLWHRGTHLEIEGLELHGASMDQHLRHPLVEHVPWWRHHFQGSKLSGAHILNITSESLEKAELVEENRNWSCVAMQK